MSIEVIICPVAIISINKIYTSDVNAYIIAVNVCNDVRAIPNVNLIINTVS
jgi:hypothetical protein